MNNYCSQKFWWLTVEPERRQIQSCCAAYPHKIDLNWIKNNPGQMFNDPVLLQERQDMLNGAAVDSCESSCWSAEREGKPSRRLQMQSHKITHTNVYSDPEILSINLGSNCNLTCVYCTKQYSTAWLNDIVKNGPYLNHDRYQINQNDQIILNLGQKTATNSDSYQLIVQQLNEYKNCREIFITGGEPFLYNNLIDMIQKFQGKKIRLCTGLGVDTTRLKRILKQLPDNVEFIVSAENLYNHYEFVRYNNSFKKFVDNLNILKQNANVSFNSVISNLTIFNFAQFEEYFADHEITMNFCNEPNYLSLNVLDSITKEKIVQTCFQTNSNLIKQTVVQDYTADQKHNLITFLKHYVSRRNLDLDIFPKHFTTWLNTSQ